MRRLSVKRRRVVSAAGSVAAFSGIGPLLTRGHPGLELAWIGLMATLLVGVIVLMVRLRQDEGCG
jgi:hypothetical protein